MLLFLIHVAIVVILWVIFIIAKRRNCYSDVAVISQVAGVIMSVILFCHIAYIGVEQCQVEPLKTMQAKRDAIVWEMENLENVEGLVDFNRDLTYGKLINDNIWLNWYVNDVVDEIELIDVGS